MKTHPAIHHKHSFLLLLLTLSITLLISTSTFAEELPLFDGHVHYNEDVWEPIPPDSAIARLKKQGIHWAIVNSTPAEGTLKLERESPGFVIPFIRPYRVPADRYTWYNDPEILDHLRAATKEHSYYGIGEFHLFDAQVDTPTMQGILKLASEKNLVLLAHVDLVTLDALFNAAPSVTIIWAHGGFDVDVDTLRDRLTRFENLYIELSFREGITNDGILTEEWKSLLTDHSDRFFIGTDTYTPQRWLQVPELVTEYKHWLNQLPANVAKDIAYQNGLRLFDLQAPKTMEQ